MSNFVKFASVAIPSPTITTISPQSCPSPKASVLECLHVSPANHSGSDRLPNFQIGSRRCALWNVIEDVRGMNTANDAVFQGHHHMGRLNGLDGPCDHVPNGQGVLLYSPYSHCWIHFIVLIDRLRVLPGLSHGPLSSWPLNCQKKTGHSRFCGLEGEGDTLSHLQLLRVKAEGVIEVRGQGESGQVASLHQGGNGEGLLQVLHNRLVFTAFLQLENRGNPHFVQSHTHSFIVGGTGATLWSPRAPMPVWVLTK